MMKTFALILALIVLASAEDGQNWDELEDLLENPDEFDAVAEETKKPTPQVKDVPDVNPCDKHHCGWGKECVLDKDGKASCDCIRTCPTPADDDPFDKVCSNQNKTFDSLCHLYQQKCLCKRNKDGCTKNAYSNAHLEYLGGCKELEICTEEHMAQFPERMADWLFEVMKEMKDRQEIEGDDWLTMLQEAETDDEYKHIYPVLWKFCDLDRKPHDSHVSQHELIPITAPVIPMESCIRPFLAKCDGNDDGKITLQEWGKCLGLKEGEIRDKC